MGSHADDDDDIHKYSNLYAIIYLTFPLELLKEDSLEK
jgi:hypothetical protein